MAPFDRAKLARLADGLMVAVAVSLPWSTSATGILLALWLGAFIPTLAWRDVRRELAAPAGGLPVLLFLLGLIGMAWADVTLFERWKGLDGFIKLLVIPLLMVQARRSANSRWIFIGFLIACGALLVASWVVTIWPGIPRGPSVAGVPVKSYIVQSAEFTLCAAGLLYFAVEAARERHWAKVVALVVLSLAFLSDIFFIATGRTSLVVIPLLILLYCGRYFGWKGLVAAAAAGIALAAVLWAASPYLRDRADAVFTLVQPQLPDGIVRATSTGERIAFWRKSLGFVESAPLIGHGTGSITEMFARSAVGKTGASGEVSSNPHNQTFAVAIQLGLIGAAVLWAMWGSHLFLLRGGGGAAWIGLIVVVQNIVGSLFNSFLFDFTEGWLYVIGFGVAAGMVLRQRDAAGTGAARTP